jgi:hypothetical protein
MKKVFQLAAIIAVVALAPEISKAQLVGGRYFAGGYAYYSNTSKASQTGSSTTTQPGETTVGFYPSLGYMLSDKWAMIAGIGYTSTITEIGQDGDSRATPTFRVNAGVRRFLFSDKGGLFVDGEISTRFITNQTKTGNTVTSLSATGIYAGVSLGAAYFLTNRLMLNGTFATIGFDSYTNNTSDNSKNQTNLFSLIVNPVDITFGLSYFF